MIEPAEGDSGDLSDSYGRESSDEHNAWPWADYGMPSIFAVKIASGVSLAGSARGMFSNMDALESVNLSGFDASKVTDMSCMFANCESLEKVNLSGLNAKKVKDMNSMFKNCKSLKKLDVSNFKDMHLTMFDSDDDGEDSDEHDGDLRTTDSMNGMFSGCSKLKKLDLTWVVKGDYSYDMTDAFSGCGLLKKVKIGSNTKLASDCGLLSGKWKMKRKGSKALVRQTKSIVKKAGTKEAGSKYAGTWKLVGNAANPMTVTGNKLTLDASSLKSKAKKISKKKAFTIENAIGKLTFAKVKGSEKIEVTKKGKLKVAKKTKKGNYWVKVAVTAAGNKTYLPVTKKVKVRVNVA